MRCVEKFCDEDPTFDGCREHAFILALLEAMKNKDTQAFEKIGRDYNKLTPFDKLQVKVLTLVKSHLPKEEGILEGGLA